MLPSNLYESQPANNIVLTNLIRELKVSINANAAIRRCAIFLLGEWLLFIVSPATAPANTAIAVRKPVHCSIVLGISLIKRAERSITAIKAIGRFNTPKSLLSHKTMLSTVVMLNPSHTCSLSAGRMAFACSS